MEFDQDEVVTNSLSLEFMGFPHNNSFKIFQDGLYLKDTNLSFKVSKSSVREEAFYIMSDSSISNRNISSLSCMGSVFKESMFWSCDDHIAWMIFGERLEEEEEEEKGGLRKYLPTIMIIVVFILVRKLQSFLLEKRATLVPTSFG
ncbi:hypothetical protein Gasu2_00950 [Galdieria sulphuraria]|nr:hypothetical protein Gasu2_00950 [Galdieria sulphuraria]